MPYSFSLMFRFQLQTEGNRPFLGTQGPENVSGLLRAGGLAEGERLSDAGPSGVCCLLNQVGLLEWLYHAVLQFALVQSFFLFGTHSHRYLAGHFGEVRDRVPSRVKLIAIRAEREFNLGLQP